MKKFLALVACCLIGGSLRAEEFGETADFDHWYVGAAVELVLPQGGSSMHRLGGASARFGYYFSPVFAFDAQAAWMENKAGLSAKALWHLQGFEWWGMMFGYERFDPFLTVGAKGWINHGQVGPVLGIGAMYYLSDHWALRFDADLTIGVESDVETIHSLSAGVQYSF